MGEIGERGKISDNAWHTDLSDGYMNVYTCQNSLSCAFYCMYLIKYCILLSLKSFIWT